MDQELIFALDLGRLALPKKNIWANSEQFLKLFFSSFHGKKKIWADYEQLFRPVFSSFHGQKKKK